MTKTITTDAAVEALFRAWYGLRPDQPTADWIEPDDLDAMKRNVGAPDEGFVIVQTKETVDDYRKAGWIDEPHDIICGKDLGVACLKWPTRKHKEATWVYIADVGNHRLMHVMG